MVGAIVGVLERMNGRLPDEALLGLHRSGTDTIAHQRRVADRVRRRVKPLLLKAIESDLVDGCRPVRTPSGLDVPEDWWDAYVRLDELGNDSLLLFLLDDLLDPPPADRSVW
jgi:hypothetical protein